jgi:hypothetical protein
VQDGMKAGEREIELTELEEEDGADRALLLELGLAPRSNREAEVLSPDALPTGCVGERRDDSPPADNLPPDGAEPVDVHPRRLRPRDLARRDLQACRHLRAR